MPIKNYTTQIPASRTISEIQQILANHGAKSIMVDYDDSKKPMSLSFLIPTSQGELPFQLPANIAAIARILAADSVSNYRSYDKKYQEEKAKKIADQAYRVAWRILKDWIDAQCAIIESDMVKIEQVFFPYMTLKDGTTMFQAFEQKHLTLPPG